MRIFLDDGKVVERRIGQTLGGLRARSVLLSCGDIADMCRVGPDNLYKTLTAVLLLRLDQPACTEQGDA